MRSHGVNRIVVSSTANVYCRSAVSPIGETDALHPESPYGEAKLTIEKILKWADRLHGVRYAALRYFNAAGAHINGTIGECHNPETHLVPLVLQSALGLRDEFVVMGNDYGTKDGTCVRDFVHVSDLAAAHVLALERINKGRSDM